MHLREARIHHIKGLTDLHLDFGDDILPGWHVILGDNGAGKTTLIRALALAFVGPLEAMALREDWTRWIQVGHDAASIRLGLDMDPAVDIATRVRLRAKLGLNPHDHSEPPRSSRPRVSRLTLRRRLRVEAHICIDKVAQPGQTTPPQATLTGDTTSTGYVWSTNPGWFSASFGPSRRFSGGGGDYQRIFYSNPRVARHLSAFSEQVAFSEALIWLVERKRAGAGEFVEKVQRFINGGLLPHGVTLTEVTDQTLRLMDGNGVSIDVTQLSDGYRSGLSLALELLRQMEVCYGADTLIDPAEGKVLAPGVVLIDEIDSHLHPSWQASVGEWFVSCFPNVQFIVATHSVLVCRSIGKTGRVFRLSAPGQDGPQLSEITGEERDKLWYGSIDRALGSEGFGLQLGRSDYGRERVAEMGALTKAAHTRKLTAAERERLQYLRVVLADARTE